MRGVDGEAVTSDLYPDIGCLRFVEARGVCDALRLLRSRRLIGPFMLEASGPACGADSRAAACVVQCVRGRDASARIARCKQRGSRSAWFSVLSVTFVQYGERLNELCEVSYGSCRA
jgi:hypothetical protein